jgi:pSer/pThr/pTyr-binding forkhead associated (FHA) protein
VFKPTTELSEFVVGRHSSCDVKVDDTLISKFQCTIYFNPGNGWVLLDGHNEKQSTNGTWLYISEDLKIYSTMIFKASQTLFEAELYQ